MILVIRKMIGELNSTGRLYMYIYSMCDLLVLVQWYFNRTSLLCLESDFWVLLTTLAVENSSKLKRVEKSQNAVFRTRPCA